MQKGIKIFIDGDVNQFLEHWKLPSEVKRMPGGNKLRFFLHGEDTNHFALV